jgi:hypothetical protein
MKAAHFSPLHSMHVIAPDGVGENIEQLFEYVTLKGVVAVLTWTADGGMIGSAHLIKNRIH